MKNFLIIGISSILSLNATSISINKAKFTEQSVAKIYCNFLKEGNIKEISKHFQGDKLDHINMQNMHGINLMSEDISSRYADADCNYINLKNQNNKTIAYPFGVSWNMSFSINKKLKSWKALKY